MTSAAHFDFFKSAVATLIIVLAGAYIASYIVINVFHITLLKFIMYSLLRFMRRLDK